jgi:hypothetical protein
VEVFYDGLWYRAKGTSFWGVTLRIPLLENDMKNVVISVRAFDGILFAYDNVTINIKKYEAPLDLDRDRDGVPNDFDEFPDDPTEWMDSDGDGIGDNKDRFPNNPIMHADSDLDGYGDEVDSHPFDPMLWNDRDNDGSNDDEDINIMSEDATSGEDGVSILPILLWVVAAAMLIIAIVSAYSYYDKKRASKDPVRSAKYMSRINKRRMFWHDLSEKLPFVHASQGIERMVSGSGGSASPAPHIHAMPGRPAMPGPSPVKALPAAPQQVFPGYNQGPKRGQ